ncbi:MAG: carboxymuconolactone decarboxylase family protein [Burkholderiaceae bacterium]
MNRWMAAAMAWAVCGVATAAEPDLQITRADTRTARPAAAQHFSGEATVDMLHTPTAPARVSVGSVTFSPGVRTAWHTHPLGQTLLVTAGAGLVQRWGGPVVEMRVGDVVHIPPQVKHWHGAAPGSAMTHLAISEAQDGNTVTWLEPAAPAPVAQSPSAAAPLQPSRAQQLMGGVAPKLAQLTDDVLYADVWARPGLSPRDRSLITVSALIGMNRPDQLRSHLVLGKANGLTQAEVGEVLTHLAFYAGWPNAVTAAGVARDVLSAKP